MKFTVRGIAALKPKANRYDVLESDGHGFGIRVAPSGRKSWIYLYHHGGRLRRMTLGTYPHHRIPLCCTRSTRSILALSLLA